MTVKQNRTVVRQHTVPGARVAVPDANADWTKTSAVLDVVSCLPQEPTRHIARAPFSLDVMGGLADYSGALSLHLPLGDYVCAAVQKRDDRRVVVQRCEGFRVKDPSAAGGAVASDRTTVSERAAASDGDAAWGVSLDDLLAIIKADDVSLLDAQLPKHDDPSHDGMVERCSYGVFAELIRAGLIDEGTAGLTVAVGCSACVGRSSVSSIASAVLTAMSSAFDLELEPSASAKYCETVECRWLGVPVGVSAAAGSLMGESANIGQYRCDANALAGRLPLPTGIAIIGVACGSLHPDFLAKYRRVRTATFMGRSLIDRIIQHEGVGDLQWDGHLSRVSVSDYVERFRDRIPTRLKGAEFLERFGETGDALTKIEPDFVYKIRSRTEHHIYEHSRSRQVVEGVSRYARSGDPAILHEVGEAMYASHWSYGQRCGLGSIPTDLLVNTIRRFGEHAGIYGARISGRGCGGTVAVLMDDTEAAEQAVQQACQAYQEKSGKTPTILRGSLPGAMVAGARSI